MPDFVIAAHPNKLFIEHTRIIHYLSSYIITYTHIYKNIKIYDMYTHYTVKMKSITTTAVAREGGSA